jgi:O-antigen/teichoic acid export membrane protein
MGVIRRQGIKNTIAGYAGIFIGFLNLIVIQPRFLTPEELGLTRILYSFSILVAVFVPLGIGNATIKYFPEFRDPKKNHHGFFAFMNLFPLAGFFLACLLLWIFRGFILNQYRTESPLFLEYFDYVFPLIFLNAFISNLNVYCNSNFKTTVPVYINEVLVRLLTILVVSVYFLKWVSLNQFIILFVAIYALQLFLLVAYVYHFDRPSLRIDWKIFREKHMFKLIRYGMLLWFAGIASIGLKYFDSIMIGKFMPLAFVGIYTIAAFIPTVIEAPLNAFEKIAAAKISFAWNENDREQINSIYHKSSLYMFLVGGFLFLVINLNIHSLLKFLPETYRQGEIVVLIISFGTLFNMATGLNAPILFNSDKYRYGAFFLILLAVIVLVFQMIFIPLFGIAGAAVATSSASILYNSMLFISVFKFFGLQPFDRKNLRVLFTILFVFTAVYFIPHLENPVLDIALRTAEVSLFYFLAIYYLKVIPEFHQFLPWNRK